MEEVVVTTRIEVSPSVRNRKYKLKRSNTPYPNLTERRRRHKDIERRRRDRTKELMGQLQGLLVGTRLGLALGSDALYRMSYRPDAQ
jgi:hypothetical protein